MVLEHFKNISRIPRGSKNNKAISDYLVQFAEEHGLRYIQDEALNVVIFKDSTPGYEHCEPLIIQGHMDMVCEKIAGIEHDFTKDSLELIEENGYLRANGTTLGGDDGIAIAYMLEYLTDDTLVHPALEMVITTDEEIGMDGAKVFDASCLKGRRMINIDSEEEGIFTVSCAGGLVGEISFDAGKEVYEGVKADITLSGLKGGHSGVDIAKNRHNAIVTLGRLIGMLPINRCKIMSLEGGTKDNVIPNKAILSIVINPEYTQEVIQITNKAIEVIENECRSAEPSISFDIAVNDKAASYSVLDDDTYARVRCFLTYVPNGVQVMSASIEGMVESSCNVGVFATTGDIVKATVSMRSSKQTYIDYMDNKLQGLCAIIDGKYCTHGGYPGWDMKTESEFRNIMCEVYKDMYGKDAIVKGVHAGLEGGIFIKKIPDMDIVSIGPNMYDIHTVNEKIEIESVLRVDSFLRRVITACTE